ncbi:hypothetical protein [Tautonia plasticadhaerens]|uniref:Uncharacterized protein n=1 Tax=Tautonia plasticadhaerens TaxID=2527974 RepID=A0A518GUC0_9BACT|nr:hypothetical protein [Tautonia plasticadhaerens]QDV32183.1 hypothetical protein ElP_00060 [Tautonia plasticadhaerens]
MPPSLCPCCAWKRDVVTGRGSRFLLCRRSSTDRDFPKYPMQPVRSCPGFEPPTLDRPGPDPVGERDDPES